MNIKEALERLTASSSDEEAIARVAEFVEKMPLVVEVGGNLYELVRLGVPEGHEYILRGDGVVSGAYASSLSDPMPVYRSASPRPAEELAQNIQRLNEELAKLVAFIKQDRFGAV